MKHRLESFPGLLFLLLIVSCGGKQNGKISDTLDSSYMEESAVDSAYMDSIARRNFTSYDLTFNELHGDVKEVKYHTPPFWWDITTLKFDEDGNWLNVPEWTKEDKIYNNRYCTGKPEHKTIRDKEGRISKIYFPCETDWDYFEYKWTGGSLKGNTLGDFTFSSDGFLISSEEDDIEYTKTVYTDYILDGMGNWIERTANSFTYDGGFPITKEVNKEKREISYFKSSPQGRFPLENTPEQTKLLAHEKNKYKKTLKNEDQRRNVGDSYASQPKSNLNGHEAVDLGLSVKWARCNLGASSEFERGDFFLWQEYNDPAMQRWGGSWRTPTLSEFKELYQLCSWEWKSCTYSNDHYKYCTYGYLITGPNGKSIFLPANGRKYQSENASSINLYEDGFYWTRSYLMERGSVKPYVCSFDFGRIYFPNYDNVYAMGIRPVTY